MKLFGPWSCCQPFSCAFLSFCLDRGCRDHLRDDQVPTSPGLELLKEPVFERLRIDRVLIGTCFVEDDTPPVACPFAGVIVGVEKLINDQRPFFRVLAVNKLLDDMRRRNLTGQVQCHAAQEGLVVDNILRSVCPFPVPHFALADHPGWTRKNSMSAWKWGTAAGSSEYTAAWLPEFSDRAVWGLVSFCPFVPEQGLFPERQPSA